MGLLLGLSAQSRHSTHDQDAAVRPTEGDVRVSRRKSPLYQGAAMKKGKAYAEEEICIEAENVMYYKYVVMQCHFILKGWTLQGNRAS
ncbi:MAG: hypothetical protein HWE26_03605 [Alteromonadaceae bacterium]|nr:hypothetical protein [Alteromonadaceae bacterium]